MIFWSTFKIEVIYLHYIKTSCNGITLTLLREIFMYFSYLSFGLCLFIYFGVDVNCFLPTYIGRYDKRIIKSILNLTLLDAIILFLKLSVMPFGICNTD